MAAVPDLSTPSGIPESAAADAARPRAGDHRLQALIFDEALEPQFVWERGEPRRIVLWNRAAERLFGYSRDEAQGRDPRSLLATNLATNLVAPADAGFGLVDASLDQDGSWRGQLEQRTASGDLLTLQTSMRVLRDAGRPVVLETAQDVTTERAAAARFAASEASSRALANTLPQIVWLCDAEGRLQWLNDRWVELTGLAGDRLDEASWRAVIHPDDLEGVLARWSEALASGDTCEIEYRLRDRRRGFRWHLARISPVRDAATGPILRWVAAATDIDDRRRAEAALRDSEHRARARADELAALMDVVPAAVWIARDPSCTQIDGNRAGHEMLHARPSVNLSKTAPDPSASAHFTVLRDGVELRPEDLPLQTAARTGEPVRDFAEEIRFSNGEHIHIYGNAYPLRDDQGRPRGAVAAFIDVTRLRQSEEAMRLANRRKDEFLAMLSHELRNPLAPIVTAVQLMQRRGDVATPKERAVIARQATHLARLVDDLLDVSRVARGKITLRRAPRELKPLVERALEAARPLLEERRHQVRVDVPATGLRVDCDEVRIIQVITNLLTNAARYTPPGGHVDVSARREEQDVVLRVRDDGTGIDPALLPDIFDMFVQGPRNADRAEGGLGLGLALVRRLTELHGGVALARSDGPGRGSELTIRLPCAVARTAHAAISGGEPRPAAAAPRGRRILLVEDNRDGAEMLAMLLTEAGHTVQVAVHPHEAIEAAKRCRPDLAILDIGLPVMNGYELAAALRAQLGREAPTLIALSGYGQSEDKARSHDAGFTLHLVKPIVPERLLQIVDELAI